MLTRENILNQWAANGWQDLKVTCPDGAEAVLSPCFPPHPAPNVQMLEYVLVTCDLPYLGGDNLDQVIDRLNRHAELVREANDEKARLNQFFEKHIAPGNFDGDTWGTYSDWHKDVYGYRPHGVIREADGRYVNPHREEAAS